MARLPIAGLCGAMAIISLAACSAQSGAPPGPPQSAPATLGASAAPAPGMRATPSGPRSGVSQRLAAVPGEYLVKFRPAGKQQYAMGVLRAAAFNVAASFPRVQSSVYASSAGQAHDEGLRQAGNEVAHGGETRNDVKI